MERAQEDARSSIRIELGGFETETGLASCEGADVQRLGSVTGQVWLVARIDIGMVHVDVRFPACAPQHTGKSILRGPRDPSEQSLIDPVLAPGNVVDVNEKPSVDAADARQARLGPQGKQFQDVPSLAAGTNELATDEFASPSPPEWIHIANKSQIQWLSPGFQVSDVGRVCGVSVQSWRGWLASWRRVGGW